MSTKIRDLLRFLSSLLIRLIAAIVLGVFLLTLVFLIPGEKLEPQVIASAKRMSLEFTWPDLYVWCTSKLDNWTDSTMLLHAAYQDDSESPVQQAMQGYWYLCDEDPHASIVKQYIDHDDTLHRAAYPRYWHGYLLWLKPLLCFISYPSIRWINGATQCALLLLLLLMMWKKGLKAYIPPLLIIVGLLMPVYLAKSLQCSSCYYLMLLGCLAVVASKDCLKQREALIFFWIGVGVAFFDFLTYPIATIGVPATLCFVIHNGPSIKDDFRRLFKLCFCWCFGYGGMWGGKWIAGSLITGTNIISEAFQAAALRTSAKTVAEADASSFQIIPNILSSNWDAFWNTPVTYFFWIAVLVFIIIYIFRVFKNKQNLAALRTIVVLPVIACMPFVWYAVLANHSKIHAWFTNKALAVFAFAVLCMCVKLVESAKTPCE